MCDLCARWGRTAHLRKGRNSGLRPISHFSFNQPKCQRFETLLALHVWAIRVKSRDMLPECLLELPLSNSDMQAQPSRWTFMFTCFHTCRTRTRPSQDAHSSDSVMKHFRMGARRLARKRRIHTSINRESLLLVYGLPVAQISLRRDPNASKQVDEPRIGAKGAPERLYFSELCIGLRQLRESSPFSGNSSPPRSLGCPGPTASTEWIFGREISPSHESHRQGRRLKSLSRWQSRKTPKLVCVSSGN